MQYNRSYGFIALGVALFTIGSGAWYADNEQLYCLTDRCHRAVAAEKAAIEAKKREDQAISEITKLVAEAVQTRSAFDAERLNLLREVLTHALKKQSEASSAEQLERIQQARMQNMPWMKEVPEGFLAIESSKERIRGFQVAQLDWQQWVNSARHDDFFAIPHVPECEVRKKDCAKLLDVYALSVAELQKTWQEYAASVGMSEDSRIKRLSAVLSGHAETVGAIAKNISKLELQIRSKE